MVELAAQPDEPVSDAAIQYINRLSDFLFVASRAVNDNGAGRRAVGARPEPLSTHVRPAIFGLRALTGDGGTFRFRAQADQYPKIQAKDDR